MTAHYFWQEFTEGSGHACKTQLQHSTAKWLQIYGNSKRQSASDSAQKLTVKYDTISLESELQITYYYPTRCDLLLLKPGTETKN